VLETRIAYMRFKFKVVVETTRLTPPEEIAAKVEGTPLGVVGRLTATATTRLAEAGTGTVIRYAIDATLTGKLGSMGQPVLKAKAKDMEKQFSARLAAAFAGGTAPGTTS
jgi:carbon monoxide dehydrogenase subunit G